MTIESGARARRVPRGEDCLDEQRGMGITSLQFKVTPAETGEGLFVIEQTVREKGGPPRHVHPDQEEWFYVIEGEFLVEVGQESITLRAGDSVLAPRGVPHSWGYTSEGVGRMLIAFTPAGRMEAFFREVTKANAMPPQDPALWRAHGMEVSGPPLLAK
jgi:quercetin dioxygenase-like cupin family protein